MAPLPSPAASPSDQEQVLARFEAAWRNGPAPAIDQFLSPGNRPLLEELVKIDLNYRWQRRAHCLRLEEYVARHPTLGPPEQLPLDLIGTEYWVRLRYGDQPTQNEYVARFPRHGSALLTELRRVEAELATEQQPRPAADRVQVVVPTAPVAPAAIVPGPDTLVSGLRSLPLLSAGQLDEVLKSLQPRFSDSRALAKELLKRGWLTPYQVNLLLQGRGQELLLGPYVVLERLGSGGGGQVFKARHPLMQRIAAVKVIRKDLLTDSDVVNRFQREILSISQLTHPNIVQAYDAGAIGPGFYLAMEYVEGIDLARLVQRDGPLPVEIACEYAHQAALGLQHISERGLVHRDIKPSNLFLARVAGEHRGTEPGSLHAPLATPVVKILDLGLARVERPVGEVAALTDSGAVMMGTLDFMAPEQAVNSHEVDARADIYSLGCTLFFLLTGKAPYSGGTMAQTLLRHQQAAIPNLGQFRGEAPPRLTDILHRMMAKQPEDRFPTSTAVAEALAPFTRPDSAGALVPFQAPVGRLVPRAEAITPGPQVIVIDPRPIPVRKRILPALDAGRRGVAWLRCRPRLALAGLAALVMLFFFGWVVFVPSGPKEMYLAVLREEPPNLNPGSEFRKDGKYRQYSGKIQDITIRGTMMPHSLLMRPPRAGSTVVTYQLGGRFRWFKATVGLVDGSSSVDSLRFKVMGDGKLLWESKIIGTTNDREDCHVNIRGVTTLQLSAYWNTPNHESFPVWIEPQVGR
jgi:serine/threonine-protein kinase